MGPSLWSNSILWTLRPPTKLFWESHGSLRVNACLILLVSASITLYKLNVSIHLWCQHWHKFLKDNPLEPNQNNIVQRAHQVQSKTLDNHAKRVCNVGYLNFSCKLRDTMRVIHMYGCLNAIALNQKLQHHLCCLINYLLSINDNQKLKATKALNGYQSSLNHKGNTH